MKHLGCCGAAGLGRRGAAGRAGHGRDGAQVARCAVVELARRLQGRDAVARGLLRVLRSSAQRAQAPHMRLRSTAAGRVMWRTEQASMQGGLCRVQCAPHLVICKLLVHVVIMVVVVPSAAAPPRAAAAAATAAAGARAAAQPAAAQPAAAQAAAAAK